MNIKYDVIVGKPNKELAYFKFVYVSCIQSIVNRIIIINQWIVHKAVLQTSTPGPKCKLLIKLVPLFLSASCD